MKGEVTRVILQLNVSTQRAGTSVSVSKRRTVLKVGLKHSKNLCSFIFLFIILSCRIDRDKSFILSTKYKNVARAYFYQMKINPVFESGICMTRDRKCMYNK